MDLGLQGKTVIVTASSKGLGKATAHQFAAEGANVIISSRSEEELQQTVKDIQSETGHDHISYVVADMTKAEDITNLVNKTVERHGAVDVLVNNTGGPPAGTFDDVDDDDWQFAFELNLLSFIRTTRAVLPYMRKGDGGRIINLASSSIQQPIDNLILSNTFRTGILGLSKSLSQELAGDNILVNTVGPGRIATDRVASLDQITADKLNKDYDDLRQETEQKIPIGRYGQPDEFAKIITFLGSQANTYLTGQSFVVDGGMVKAI